LALLLLADVVSLPSSDDAILDHDDQISLFVGRLASVEVLREVEGLPFELLGVSRMRLRLDMGDASLSGKRGCVFEELVEVAMAVALLDSTSSPR
jgi:hypothetical protein